ncbi:type IIL restriction-modification enzyme MmeI, partial [Acinetobacter baumannii]
SRSLADHYNPLAMAPELIRAHRELDAAVDKSLGLKGHVSAESRLRALLSSYAKLTTVDELAIAAAPTRKKRAKAPA